MLYDQDGKKWQKQQAVITREFPDQLFKRIIFTYKKSTNGSSISVSTPSCPQVGSVIDLGTFEYDIHWARYGILLAFGLDTNTNNLSGDCQEMVYTILNGQIMPFSVTTSSTETDTWRYDPESGDCVVGDNAPYSSYESCVASIGEPCSCVTEHPVDLSKASAFMGLSLSDSGILALLQSTPLLSNCGYRVGVNTILPRKIIIVRDFSSHYGDTQMHELLNQLDPSLEVTYIGAADGVHKVLYTGSVSVLRNSYQMYTTFSADPRYLGISSCYALKVLADQCSSEYLNIGFLITELRHPITVDSPTHIAEI
jgi:hypothetical protein